MEQSTPDLETTETPAGDERGQVLVVDDNKMNRIKLARHLEQQGHSVSTAENGQEALEMLRSRPFELVLLDIMMPVMNGYEVLEIMKGEHDLRDIPVIVISAVEEMDSVVRCIEMGAEDHLPKNYDPVLLNARIGASVEKRRLRNEVVEQLDIISEIFGKYVPKSVARQIVANKGILEPKQTIATIMFTDIEGFTSTAESISPKQLVQMLNEYFPAVIEPITRYGGVVNQFQGDAMLVTFNVPVEDAQHADNAVKAAIEIQAVMKNQNFSGITLRTRIGISTGEVVAGNVGAGDRINYTVYGDAVNLAARLEQLNKDYDSYVLISGATVSLLTNSYPTELIGETSIRGKHEPVQLFKLAI
jgi:class 3 adenylate cyclase